MYPIIILGPQISPTDIKITAVNATCVSMSWEPPEYPNGQITGYKVGYNYYRYTNSQADLCHIYKVSVSGSLFRFTDTTYMCNMV